MPDLRGYGDSSRPAVAADHANHSKRAMALDTVGLMGPAETAAHLLRHFG